MCNHFTHLTFDPNISKKKPKTILNPQTRCPFCNRSNLEIIIDEDGPILLVENKFRTLKNTYQTVLIETDECDIELSQYPKDHLYKLIKFGIKHWFQMMDSGKYESVLFFKNHGPLSGGSVHHPHMQIVGLENVNYRDAISLEQFEGVKINIENNIEFNISTKPKIGFYEFNILIENLNDIQILADYIQITVHYLLNNFIHPCNSYNLFFYYVESKVIVKIVPRFVTSPIFIGYSIPQVSLNVDKIAKEIKDLYF
jgi:ATP adenylyltransferase/5',5'''-P-1,P-4-tetraphosphate phosphorylase II